MRSSRRRNPRARARVRRPASRASLSGRIFPVCQHRKGDHGRRRPRARPAARPDGIQIGSRRWPGNPQSAGGCRRPTRPALAAPERAHDGSTAHASTESSGRSVDPAEVPISRERLPHADDSGRRRSDRIASAASPVLGQLVAHRLLALPAMGSRRVERSNQPRAAPCRTSALRRCQPGDEMEVRAETALMTPAVGTSRAWAYAGTPARGVSGRATGSPADGIASARAPARPRATPPPSARARTIVGLRPSSSQAATQPSARRGRDAGSSGAPSPGTTAARRARAAARDSARASARGHAAPPGATPCARRRGRSERRAICRTRQTPCR